MRFSTEEISLINLAAGAGLAWLGSGWTQRRARKDARLGRRRDAYAAFILALDHLERTWNAPETLEAEHEKRKLREVTAGAFREINRSYVPVLLVGSDEAKEKARTVRAAAQTLSEYVNTKQPGDPLWARLGELFDAFSNAAKGFLEQAEAECGG